MLAQLEEIKPIEVRGQTFLITILRVRFDEVKKRLALGKNQTMFQDYFNAYTYLEHLTDKFEFDSEISTYRKGQVIGVDTAHAHNENMSLDEKKADAYSQITYSIEKYLDILSDLRKVVKLKSKNEL